MILFKDFRQIYREARQICINLYRFIEKLDNSMSINQLCKNIAFASFILFKFSKQIQKRIKLRKENQTIMIRLFIKQNINLISNKLRKLYQLNKFIKICIQYKQVIFLTVNTTQDKQKMSNQYQSACGLPTKSRNLQPSMFQIFTWGSGIEQKNTNSQIKAQTQKYHQNAANNNSCCREGSYHNGEMCAHQKETRPNSQVPLVNTTKQVKQYQQTYKQHQSPQKSNKKVKIEQPVKKQTLIQSKRVNSSAKGDEVIEKIIQRVQTQPPYTHQSLSASHMRQNTQSNILKNSHVFPKDIRHQLNSYEPINLKGSRPKSAMVIQKSASKQQNSSTKPVKQPKVVDPQTLESRKQKLKQFEVFTRILPNSAFTTYYGKPAFQNYGRGASCKHLKTYNVMPHKGDNNPKDLQSHYTALMKARNIKSKSYMPRNPIQDPIVPLSERQNTDNQETQTFDLPIQKPNLLACNRFAPVTLQTGKKAGPPISKSKVNRSKIQKSKQNKRTKIKSFIQGPSDGLKYLNKRQNLIELLQDKKLKASQLAYKITECYPLEWNCSNLCRSVVSNENWDHVKAAGKNSNKGQSVGELFCQIRKPLEEEVQNK